MIFRLGCLLLLALQMCRVGYASESLPLVQLADQEQVRLVPDMVRFWPESKQDPIASPLGLPESGWHSIGRSSINVGKHDYPVWFRFEVANDSAHAITRLLEIRWINLKLVEFYSQDSHTGAMIKLEAGLLNPKSASSNNNTSWVFPFALQAGETKHIYLRVASRFNVFLPMYVWEEDAFSEAQWQRYVWYGLAFGVLAAMLLYNLSLYVFTRDNSYLFYSVYAFSVILYEGGLTGVGDHLFWGHNQWFRVNGFALSIYVSFFAAALFMRNFLQLKRWGGWVLHLNTFFVGYWLLSAFVLLFGTDFMVTINELFALLSCIAALATSIWLWIKGNVSARYFTIAWGGLIALTIAAVLMMEGVLPYSMLTENGQLIGFVLEMLLLSLALAERINRERAERELAQSKALNMQMLMNSEREEKLKAQEAMLLMQQETNEALEARVAQRTQELERTMTNLEIANRELAKLSVTDPLTKVHNRRYFDETLAREIERSSRTGQALSLILVDIDHFKQFNDLYGHLVGDDCLRLVAATLKEVASRSTDLVARYGGEEFAIVLPDTKQAEAYLVAERVRSKINQLNFIYKGKRIPISASLGVVGRVIASGEGGEAIIGAADKALYEAKNQGRNCSVEASAAG